MPSKRPAQLSCGEDFIIGLAISYSNDYSLTLNAEALCEIVALHDATDHVDYVTVGHGSCLEFEGIIPAFTEGEKELCPKVGDGVIRRHCFGA